MTKSMDQKFTRQGQKGPIQYLVGDIFIAASRGPGIILHHTEVARTPYHTDYTGSPTCSNEDISHEVLDWPEIHTAGSKGTNPIPRGRYLHCCKSGTRYNPCDIAYTTPKWQERHITRIIPGPRLAAMKISPTRYWISRGPGIIRVIWRSCHFGVV
jgi:hypothetical protein